jgi:hypothetical protein
VLAEAGVVIETAESEIWLIFVAATPPTVTPETPPKFEPLIVVEVPPALGPDVTESELIEGGGSGGCELLQETDPAVVLTVILFEPGSAFVRQEVEFPESYCVLNSA